MVVDLKEQELVHCGYGFGAVGGDDDTRPAVRFLVSVADVRLQPLHDGDPGRSLPVDEHRCVKVAVGEHP